MKSNWVPRACLGLVVSTLLLAASDAHAERIVLLQFSGRKSTAVREKVAASLKRAGHTVIRSKVSSRKFGPKMMKRVGKNADAVLGGRVESARKGDWRVVLSVGDPKEDTSLDEDIEFSGDTLQALTKDVGDNVVERLETAMADEPPPPPPVPEPVEPTPEPSVEAPVDAEIASAESASDDASLDAGTVDENAADASKGKRPMARLTASAGYVRREFDFREDIYEHLRTLSSNSWVYRAQGEVFPFKGDIGERIGFVASYEGKLAGKVDDLDYQLEYPVLHSELFVGVRARFPLAGNELGGDLGIGSMQAGLDDASDVASIPDLQYTFLRALFDYALNVGPLDVRPAIGLRLPFGFGEVSETRWFPRVGGYGLEAGVDVGYPLSQRVSLEAAGSVRRYVLNMNSEPEDAITGASQVAAGAVDLFASVYLGLRVSL